MLTVRSIQPVHHERHIGGQRREPDDGRLDNDKRLSTGASANNQSTFNASYLNFTRLGSSTVKTMVSYASNATTSGATTNSIQHCVFDTCGEIDFGTVLSSNTVPVLTFSNNVVQNSLKNSILSVTFLLSTATTPAVVSNNVFVESPGAIAGVTFNPPGNSTCSGNYFCAGVSHAGLPSGTTWPVTDTASGSFSNSLLRVMVNGNNWGTSIDHSYLLNDGETQNCSIMLPNAYGASKTIDTCILELSLSQNANTVGDLIEPTVNTTASSHLLIGE